MRQYVGIISNNPEYTKSVIDYLRSNGLCDQETSLYAPAHEHISASLRESPEVLKSGAAFDAPILVKDHHTRHFFSKIGKGIHAVQKFSGRTIHSGKEALDYFVGVVGKMTYGPNWLIDILLEQHEDFPQGSFVVTDLTVDDASALKAILKNDIAILTVLDPREEQEVPKITDLILRSHDKQGNAKNVQKQLTSKIKQIWKGMTDDGTDD